MNRKDVTKAVTTIVAAMILVGCAGQKKKATYPIRFHGEAAVFTEVQQNALYEGPSIETSILNVGGDIIAMHDPFTDGSLYRTSLGRSGMETYAFDFVMNDARFTYIMQYSGVFYNFVLRGQDIFVMRSGDLMNWEMMNDGQPALTHSADTASVYNRLWNVGVDVDENGLWHLLVECATAGEGQDGVGLAYATASLSGANLNFDASRSAGHVIPKGGNPYLKAIPGQGVLALHGQAFDAAFDLDGEWFITASTLQGGVWTIHKDKFAIGARGVAICDPHMAATSDGHLVLSMSVAQDSITIARGIGTFEALFNSLIQ